VKSVKSSHITVDLREDKNVLDGQQEVTGKHAEISAHENMRNPDVEVDSIVCFVVLEPCSRCTVKLSKSLFAKSMVVSYVVGDDMDASLSLDSQWGTSHFFKEYRHASWLCQALDAGFLVLSLVFGSIAPEDEPMKTMDYSIQRKPPDGKVPARIYLETHYVYMILLLSQRLRGHDEAATVAMKELSTYWSNQELIRANDPKFCRKSTWKVSDGYGDSTNRILEIKYNKEITKLEGIIQKEAVLKKKLSSSRVLSPQQRDLQLLQKLEYEKESVKRAVSIETTLKNSKNELAKLAGGKMRCLLYDAVQFMFTMATKLVEDKK
jgi:hypothetical protein